MPHGATPSRWCVCQFHHFRIKTFLGLISALGATFARVKSHVYPIVENSMIITNADGRTFSVIVLSQYLTMAAKDLGSRLAPPTRAPSISGSDIRALAFSGLTEPP